MSEQNVATIISPQQKRWLGDFCSGHGLEVKVDDTSLGIEFQTEDVTIGIYPLPDEDRLMFHAEIADLSEVELLAQPELLFALHQFNATNLPLTGFTVVIDESQLVLVRDFHLTIVDPKHSEEMIVDAINQALVIRNLWTSLIESTSGDTEQTSENPQSLESSVFDERPIFG